VTSAARTIFDLASAVPFEQAVVLADAALNAKLTTAAELAEMVERCFGRRGRERARLAIAFADERSQSVGESRSRVGMHQAQVRMPGLQHPVFRSNGSLVGRSDFDWDWLLGEFDGLHKYGRLLKPGQQPGDAVILEKLREDELRELGYHLIRWIWAELNDPRRLYARIQAKIERTERLLGRRP